MYTLLYQTKMFTMTMGYNEYRNSQYRNSHSTMKICHCNNPMRPVLRKLRICVLVNPTQLQQKSDIRACLMPV